MSDLNALNTVSRLTDGSVPLRVWLANAAHLAGPRVEGEIFRGALHLVSDSERATSTRDRRWQAESNLTATMLHQLRAPPADFTGREKDLAELVEKMGSAGVTISSLQGQGGVGKTALALKLAHALAPRYPDAQIDIDLKGVSQAPLSIAAAMAHVIRAFQPAAKLPEADDDLAPFYRSVLYGKRALLLFDNAYGKEQIEPLLPPPECIVIITSRQRFTLSGLYARSLDQLEPQEAISLLQKIAPRLGAGLAATIAHFCGYIPLSLRLAASALAERVDLEPEEYAEDLKSTQMRIDLVEASLSLSFELLHTRPQALWSRLGVFPGDFDREAAAAVGELEPGIARNMLSDLVKHSMVEYDSVTKRYRLHDLARLYAISRLNKVDLYAAERRHAKHFRSIAARADELYESGGNSIATGLALFDREWENIEVGQAWASAHAGEDTDAASLCSAYPKAGAYCLALRQHPRERILWHGAALASARLLERQDEVCVHLGHLGQAYADLGELHRSLELFERALPIFREIDDRKSESEALGSLGLVYMALGETQRAVALHEQCLEIVRELGDRKGQCDALSRLGLVYAEMGELSHAIGLCEQCLSIARELGYRQGEGEGLGNMANAYAMLGDAYHAITLYEQCLRIAREIGDRQGEATASWNLGLCYEALGDLEKAIGAMQVRIDYEIDIDHVDAKMSAVRVNSMRGQLKGLSATTTQPSDARKPSSRGPEPNL